MTIYEKHERAIEMCERAQWALEELFDNYLEIADGNADVDDQAQLSSVVERTIEDLNMLLDQEFSDA